MNLSWATLRNWLSVGASVFVGGAAGYLQANLAGGLTGTVPWKQIVIGAGVTGLVAVIHLAQVPSKQAGDAKQVGGAL